MKGLLLVSSLAPISIKCALVLNISAGKAMKLPKGKFLIFFIICGTLLYVGIVLVYINYKLNKPYYTKHIFHDEFDINKLYIVILAQVHIESVKFGYFEKLLSYSDTMLSRLSWFEVGLALTLIHWDFM